MSESNLILIAVLSALGAGLSFGWTLARWETVEVKGIRLPRIRR